VTVQNGHVRERLKQNFTVLADVVCAPPFINT
jgi:hypothetical protein